MSTIPFQPEKLKAMKIGLEALLPLRIGTAGNESRLIDAALRGNRASFDDLVKQFEPDLRAFVKRRVSEFEVDDIMQDTWVAAWGALKNFDRRSRFKTWLFGIAVNKCRDHYRASIWQRSHRPWIVTSTPSSTSSIEHTPMRLLA
jgi:RNA polymerase sigma-70 factor (ECF subfamily)